jgi:hypothetical protein
MKATQLLDLPETVNAPIACDMIGAPDTPEERLAEYGRLFAHALVERQRLADTLEFKFATRPGIADWVVDLARREAACCPFFTHDVTASEDRVVWRISSQAGPAAQSILDECHDLPERCGDGLQGFFARLGKRGVPVAPGPGGRRFGFKGSCGC